MSATVHSHHAEPPIARSQPGITRLSQLVSLLGTTDAHEEQLLFDAADRLRERRCGDGVHLRALIEFSNYCSRTCNYCGLRAENVELGRYRMDATEIVSVAGQAAELGYRTVVLQSGEDSYYTSSMIAGIVGQIKSRFGLAVTLCLGERSEREFAAWRKAGADRYLLRIETSDARLYERMHPGMSFDRRVAGLHTLRELGYQLGSGVLVGLPGQDDASLAADLLFLRGLKVDMVGVGPFIPHAQTPLAEHPGGTVEKALRMTALLRLLLPDAYVVATSALQALDPMGRESALRAGANVMMPNVTPRQYRALYEIYPSKICIGEEAAHCRGCIEGRIRSVGRRMATGYGHAGRPTP